MLMLPVQVDHLKRSGIGKVVMGLINCKEVSHSGWMMRRGCAALVDCCCLRLLLRVGNGTRSDYTAAPFVVVAAGVLKIYIYEVCVFRRDQNFVATGTESSAFADFFV